MNSRYIRLLFPAIVFAIVAAFIALTAPAPIRVEAAVAANTCTLANAGNTCMVQGLTDQSSCSFSEASTPGPVDVEGSNDGVHWQALAITDYSNPPNVQAQPITPAAGTSYQFAPTSLAYARIRADGSWSGQTTSTTIRCSGAVALRVNSGGGGGGGGGSSPCPTCVYTQTGTGTVQSGLAYVQKVGASQLIQSGYQFGTPAPAATGDIVAAESSSTGQIWLCGNGTAKPFCNIDFDVGGGTNRITTHGHLRVLSDFDTYGGAVNLNPNNTVATPTLSYVAGGALGATTYYVRVTPVSLMGEGYSGDASTEASIAVPAGNLLVVTTASNVGSTANGYSPETNNIYVSTTSGSYSTGLQATGIAPGSAWTEPTSGLVSGTALPSTDSSAGVVLSSRYGLNMPICSGIPANWSGISLPLNGNEYALSNTCSSTVPYYAGLELPIGQFTAGSLVGVTTATDGNAKLVQAAVSPCPTASCVSTVSVDPPLIESAGAPFVNIGVQTPAPTCTGAVSCTGNIFALTISGATPCPSAGPGVTVSTPWPCTISANTKHSKLAIGLGFASGTVNASTTYPVQPIVAYTNGEITAIRAACGSADNGTTTVRLLKDGTNVHTTTLSTSVVTTDSFATPLPIGAGDYVTVSIGTAGTGQNCGFIAEGQQDEF